MNGQIFFFASKYAPAFQFLAQSEVIFVQELYLPVVSIGNAEIAKKVNGVSFIINRRWPGKDWMSVRPGREQTVGMLENESVLIRKLN